MTSFFDEPQTKYLGIAAGMLALAYGLIKWVGRTMRDQLGPGMPKHGEPFLPAQVDNVPPALVKEALQRGLVTSSQLATMSPMERQFLFAALKTKLSAPVRGDAAPVNGVDAGVAQAEEVAPPPAVPLVRGASAAVFGLAAMPADDKLLLHCPLCGDRLVLPAFPPLVARCERCGAKTAVREDEGGHFVLHVSPAPQHPGVARPAP